MTETWKRRRARAAKLGAAHAPAADILGFYANLLDRQEAIFVSADRWVTSAGAGIPGGLPIDITRFAGTPQQKAFRRFVGDAGDMATPLLAVTAARLLESTTSADELLERFAHGASLDAMAGTMGCDPVALAFFPRAFIQPVAEAALARLPDQQPPGASPMTPASCPRCGWPPQLASLVDEAEVRGRRRGGRLQLAEADGLPSPAQAPCRVEARTQDRRDGGEDEGCVGNQEPWRVSTRNGLRFAALPIALALLRQGDIPAGGAQGYA